MYQKVYMTDGDSKSRTVSIKIGCSKSVREKAVRCGSEWKSRIVMIRVKIGDPKIVDLCGTPKPHVMVRLTDFELGKRKPAKRTRKVRPYKRTEEIRMEQYKAQKRAEKLLKKSKV